MSSRLIVRSLFCAVCVVLLADDGHAQYAVPASVLGGGGANISCAGFRISGTIGQTHIGRISGVAGEQDVGFWYQPRRFVTSAEHPAGVPVAPRILALYPNPVQDALVVEYEQGASEWLSLSLHDILGRCVLTVAPTMPSSTRGMLTLDVRIIPHGVYRVRFASVRAAEERLVIVE